LERTIATLDTDDLRHEILSGGVESSTRSNALLREVTSTFAGHTCMIG